MELLRDAAIDQTDARVLLRTVLDVGEAYLIAHDRDVPAVVLQARYRALVERRLAGEPVAYLTGEREFYGRAFAVSPAVLIPRPETELLVDLACERLPLHARRRVLDLGTGSGCIAISIALERSAAHVIATDYSEAALTVARNNAHRLGAGKVEFESGDWFDAIGAQQFDLVVCNPPYVAHGDEHLVQGDLRFEPASALVAQAAGYACLEAIINRARAHLNGGAWLLLEHGYDQAPRCRELLSRAEFDEVQSWRDLSGIERASGAHIKYQ